MTTQQRALILVVVAALVAGPFSARAGALAAGVPAHRYDASGATAGTDIGGVGAATPGPQAHWSGFIKVIITIPPDAPKEKGSGTGGWYQAPPNPPGSGKLGPRIKGSCSTTITIDGATESDATTMKGTVVWPDFPQKGETETTTVQSTAQAPQMGPVQPTGTVQITPHPNFGTADYTIYGFFLPPTTATIDTVINGKPADGGIPADAQPSRQPQTACAHTGWDYLAALGQAAGNGSRFSFSFPSSASPRQSGQACHLPDQPPYLTDLSPIIIKGTVQGDGSAIAGTAGACVGDIDNNGNEVGTVTVEYNLSRVCLAAAGMQPPATTAPRAVPSQLSESSPDSRLAQGAGCDVWFGTIHTTTTWPRNPKQGTIYLDSGRCVSMLTFSAPDAVSGQQLYDRTTYTANPRDRTQVTEVHVSSRGWDRVRNQHGNLTDSGGHLEYSVYPMHVWKQTSHYLWLAGQLTSLDTQEPEWHDAGTITCTPHFPNTAYFDPRQLDNIVGPYRDYAPGAGHPPAETTLEYHLHH